MGLQSFDASFRILQNLTQMARKAHFYHHRTKPRVLFISFIATVGNCPSVQGGGVLIPEVIVEDPTWTLKLGYAKAKLLCEEMIQRATDDYPIIEAGLVRSDRRRQQWLFASSQKTGRVSPEGEAKQIIPIHVFGSQHLWHFTLPLGPCKVGI